MAKFSSGEFLAYDEIHRVDRQDVAQHRAHAVGECSMTTRFHEPSVQEVVHYLRRAERQRKEQITLLRAILQAVTATNQVIGGSFTQIPLGGIMLPIQPGSSPEFQVTPTFSGNPFALIGVDRPGRAAIDWGVYGVPETFIVRGDGTIAYKLVGEITAENIDTVLVPKIREAMR